MSEPTAIAMPEPTVAMNWESRIIGHGFERPDQLLKHPDNFRVHPIVQQESMSGVLNEIGWVSPIIVNQQTGHLIDGHMRLDVAGRSGEALVPVSYVDLTPEEELAVLAVYDRIGDSAIISTEKMAALLANVPTINDDAFAAMLEDMREQYSGAFTLPQQATDAAYTPNPMEDYKTARAEQYGDDRQLQKVLQCFLSLEEHRQVMAMLRELAGVYETANVTDTVVHAITKAHDYAMELEDGELIAVDIEGVDDDGETQDTDDEAAEGIA